ncbi:Cell wall alpha-1,3-glucan synthase ags1 [Coniosporium tulheliwenetii]|uniref:Cell wall alpha-1,3-glucan synthase ags1 n=1 Tax=Coniosporium tulheliwenetii TaxID=3383036 RepID=A0ACC2YXA3_9PEZI|nr:Cell wall alpha-1,3-glucan synthase ags1 [Cladosporium sp. JES 115]
MKGALGYLLAIAVTSTVALRYDPAFVEYNLNENATAVHPLDYWGEYSNHTYHPSPKSWRFPFYTLFLDKYANGDPSNDDINGTSFEHDLMSTQMRHGGDLQGLVDSLDYIQGMGIRGLYIAGSPFINQPWGADAYSPLDFTLLDKHFGTIKEWRMAIEEIHRRGMYVVLDNTMATMGDLIGFDGYLNETTPFDIKEHKVSWKGDRRYLDFDIGNDYNESCTYPRFWLETGYPAGKDVTDRMKGCYNSDFDQYGDTEAFGVFPDWQRQLSKFASVQDRLREWHDPVLERLKHFSCIAIQMLDIDGWRIDKATQVTVDAQAEWSDHMRQCARRLGKQNFFIPGEITGGNTFGSIYLGRGRQPDMVPGNLSEAVRLTNTSDDKYFIRDLGKNALDAGAFHYSIYRSLTRFLGMDGNLAAGFDTPVNWVDAWRTMVSTNDLVNANTGVFDPRHMYGVGNQDVFRWPGIKNGTEKMLLGTFITTLHMPGIPKLIWGEEQAFYILDNTASNYIFGRQAMSAALAWQNHGCYKLGSAQYYEFPVDAALHGCNDDSVSLDHRDPSHPVRNIIKHMYHMREAFPVLNDGWFLQQLSNQTRMIQLPGSNQTETETGMWSVLRSQWENVQDLSGEGKGNQSVWLVYQNDNSTIKYQFNCSSEKEALVAPFDEGTTVKNLFYPYEEINLKASATKFGFFGSTEFNGCVDELELGAWGFKAFVPRDQWVGPPPMITNFYPGHDARVQSKVAAGKQESVDIELHFNTEMECESVTASIRINSTTEDLRIAELNKDSVKCAVVDSVNKPRFDAGIPTAWTWKATLDNVSNGIHAVTVRNASTFGDNVQFTGSTDRFLFRTGQLDNPMTFPRLANYTGALLHRDPDGSLRVSHKAAGADKWRYSLTWGSSWSDWAEYKGGNNSLQPQPWSGTKRQEWSEEHLMVQYWSRLSGSSSVMQHADLNWEDKTPRRFPHLFAHGPFNQYGFDAGLRNEFQLERDGRWKLHFMHEWPAEFQLNVWGMNPDGQPDQTGVYGDVTDDFVLDRLPPSSLTKSAINISDVPPSPYLAYRLSLNDGNYRFELIPVGNRWVQLIIFVLSWIVPVVTAALGCWLFTKSFYGVKFNEIGISEKASFLPLAVRRAARNLTKRHWRQPDAEYDAVMMRSANNSVTAVDQVVSGTTGATKRRTVLIATIEYNIDDWDIKIKIGGLGVMAQLMGKNLGHQDLVWVVPCVGGVDYPVDQRAEPMHVTILGNVYEVQVQYHVIRNITYVLLDAPVFRKQTKSDPYPPRMDDLDSAIYYSAWNACIAETIRRFPVDLYHINDYHGAAAPLYLLPDTIPCCLSLHNAEFQGLWPMRTPKERSEVCQVFNLDPAVVQQYVQFGAVFNLLHAGASYLRVHQKGFGAVGVSKKYGKRSYARYPIFWGLHKVGKLPNPDPTDTGGWDKQLPKEEDIHVDPSFEAGRADLKRQAQDWAHLERNPNAELFVFVGRWSLQKGVDLIADIFPSVLEEHPNVQLICIGPVIDLYGKFAALKLGKMMEKYPGRVFSKPEFTALPPYIFSGAEFALIPSRDEPFGLVAVEFGRKGALGVGARVGGLGQMPGWWYTVESVTTSHLLHQFKSAIESALASKPDVRAMMRARSAKQRFPVAQWVEDLEILQSTAIKLHEKEKAKSGRRSSSRPPSPHLSPSRAGSLDLPSNFQTPRGSHSRNSSRNKFSEWAGRSSMSSRPTSTHGDDNSSNRLQRTLSLGVKAGPGHHASKPRGRLQKPRPSNVSSPRFEHVDEAESSLSEDDTRSRVGDEYIITEEEAEASRLQAEMPPLPPLPRIDNTPGSLTPKTLAQDLSPPMSSKFANLQSHDELLPPPTPFYMQSSRSSVLSVDSVVGEKKDFKLQKVDPFFTDSNGEFYRAFEARLGALDGKTSETELCIEDYLVKSEKTWFDRFREARLGKSAPSSPAPSIFRMRRDVSGGSIFNEPVDYQETDISDEFLLGNDYKPPTGLKKYMQTRLGDWPVYSLLLAFGQIIAANSYQITLLTGEVGQAAGKLYVIASIYLLTSIMWWFVFQKFKSVYVLSLPFLFYGLAFFFIGMAPFASTVSGRGWVQNVATGLYATASSSGSIFFALNFGDEGGAPVKDWVYRACIIQGTQQLYVVALCGRCGAKSSITSTPKMAAITVPIALFMWAVGAVLFIGLPDFYRQAPGKVPSFYKSLFRRKIISWFFVAVVLQNYFLSAPYGRNWSYLWSSKHAPKWALFLLIVFFFVVLWAAILWIFAALSKQHSWILPIFAIGLGAPRWCQMLWGTSSYGMYVPWAGGPVASALVGRSLWLWLGLLDTVQGVGLGMILLQTLTRIHVAFTLIAAQVIGSLATILARASAPNNLGPGDVFPDFSAGVLNGLSHAWFWIALALQLVICVGFFLFFRKEQLSKP